MLLVDVYLIMVGLEDLPALALGPLADALQQYRFSPKGSGPVQVSKKAVKVLCAAVKKASRSAAGHATALSVFMVLARKGP